MGRKLGQVRNNRLCRNRMPWGTGIMGWIRYGSQCNKLLSQYAITLLIRPQQSPQSAIDRRFLPAIPASTERYPGAREHIPSLTYMTDHTVFFNLLNCTFGCLRAYTTAEIENKLNLVSCFAGIQYRGFDAVVGSQTINEKIFNSVL